MNSEVKKYLSAIGRRGGAAKSPRKAAASAANGRKGGRPPLYANVIARQGPVPAGKPFCGWGGRFVFRHPFKVAFATRKFPPSL